MFLLGTENQLLQRSVNQFYNNLADLSEQPVLLGPIIPTKVGITFRILVKFHHQAAKLGDQVLYKISFGYCSRTSAALHEALATGTQAFQVYPGSCCKAAGCASCSESITSTHRTVQEGWTQQVSFLLTKSEAEPQSGLTC